ncbi:MAG: thiamine phosphate synthase [Gemmatimonadota bacterium]
MTRVFDRSRPLLCFVHDAGDARPPMRLWGADDLAWSLVDLVQVRGKPLGAGDLEGLTRGWVARLAGLPSRVIVNDRLDVALAAGADGVHLGRDDLALETARGLAPDGFVIGGSSHDREELLAVQAAGADYAGLGTFSATTTKPDAKPLDPVPAGLAGAVGGLEIPVLAIGGIEPATVGRALELPAVTGVAVSGAIQAAADPGAVIRALYGALRAAWEAVRQSPGRP